MRESKITRDEAFELLKKYNKDPFHIRHALTVEGRILVGKCGRKA